HRVLSHRESSRSRDSGPLAFAHGAGVGEQQIRAALDSSALPLVRSPVDRWRRRRALPALDRGGLRAAIPAFGSGLDNFLAVNEKTRFTDRASGIGWASGNRFRRFMGSVYGERNRVRGSRRFAWT